MSIPRLVLSQQTNQKPSGSIIFLHGSGDTGNGVRLWIKQLLGREWQFPHLRILFPTAPVISYTPMGGAASNVWFDRKSISPTVPECLESINSSAAIIRGLVNQEVESGIPIGRIMIGGFSMGGAMAMHIAYRMFQEISGCFAISSFLNDSSVVYEFLEKNKEKLPPLKMMHGDSDELVPSEWATKTLMCLQKVGVDGSLTIEKGISHELTKEEILNLAKWIDKKIPNI